MQNIPIFMSQGGTATLILSEIPHKQTAYIILRTILPENLPLMIAECTGFCRSCGAEHCYLSAAQPEVALPLPQAYQVLHMQTEKRCLPQASAAISLQPMTPDNDSIYQRLYNRCFQDISHALTYDREQIARIYRENQQAFLALTPEGIPCGMGELHGNELAAVGLLPEYRGRGKDLTLSLLQHCPGPEITLTVVSDNTRAIGLYRRLGFTVAGIESTWYAG